MNPFSTAPAGKFVESQSRKKRQTLYSAWIGEIPDGYFERFLKQGVQPFLAKFGYKLGMTTSEQARMLRAWAFAHVQTQRDSKSYGKFITILKCIHDGGEEEYDWFCSRIHITDWYVLADQWYSTDFLDESSDPGVSQRLDLPRIIWHMISLEGSRAHQIWLDTIMEGAEQEDGIQEDSNVAFTGNRRTFS